MKNLRKTLASLLVVLLVLASAPMGISGLGLTAEAAYSEPYTYSVTDGQATISDIDSSIGENVIIPSTIDGYPVVALGSFLFETGETVKSITIPDSVTSVDKYAFKRCTNLEEIIFGNGITDIQSNMFSYSFTKLKNVVLGDGVETIGDYAFSECTSLETITLGNNIKSIEASAFNHCESLKSIIIPDSVTSLGTYVFSGCSNLEELVIGDGITAIDSGLVMNCESLKKITIGDGVTSIPTSTFSYNYPQLESVVLGDNVSYIGDFAFADCTNLKTVTLGSALTTIDEFAFYGCTAITEINYNGLPEDWANVSIGDANEDLNGVTITFSDGTSDTITIGNGESGGETEPELFTEGNFGYYVEYEMAILAAYYDPSAGTEVVIPSTLGGYPVVAIYDGAFYSNNTIISVTIPNSVFQIGSYAFYGCTGITSIIYDGLATDWANVYIAEGNDDLNGVTINFSDGTSDTVTVGGGDSGDTEPELFTEGAFCYYVEEGMAVIASYNDSVINEIAIPSTLGGYPVVAIGEGAFGMCSTITSITIPEGLYEIGNSAFFGCSALESIIIPDSVMSIGTATFGGCTNLKTATIGSGVMYMGEMPFIECLALESITVDENNEYFTSEDGVLYDKNKTYLIQYPANKTAATYEMPNTVTLIGIASLAGSQLESVTISNSLQVITTESFTYSVKLESIIIPESVVAISGAAFSGCESLTNVYYTGSEESWANLYIEEGNEAITSAEITYNYTEECTHNYETTVTAPTCTEGGYTTYTCSLCGDSYIADEIPAAHTVKQVEAKAPTCTEIGWEAYEYCTACDYTTYTELKATGHTESSWITEKEATETTTGLKKIICTVCKITLAEEIIPIEVVEGDLTFNLEEDTFGSDVEITDIVIEVEEINLEEADTANEEIKNTIVVAGYTDYFFYDINILVNGEEIQPNKPLWIKRALPADYNPATTAAYYMADDGTMTPIESYIEDGFIYFEVSHFSFYMIVDESKTTEEEIPDDVTSSENNMFALLIDFLNTLLNFLTLILSVL